MLGDPAIDGSFFHIRYSETIIRDALEDIMDSLRDTEDARLRFRDVPTIRQAEQKERGGSNRTALTIADQHRLFAQSAQVHASLVQRRHLEVYC